MGAGGGITRTIPGSEDVHDGLYDQGMPDGVPIIVTGDGVRLVTVANAARITGQGVRTIYGWIKKGLVDVRLTPTGQKRVVVSSLFKELKLK